MFIQTLNEKEMLDSLNLCQPIFPVEIKEMEQK
jgi:hypothetical protein